jgi:hypothetical protein
MECCCSVCSCFNACCPSPRNRRDRPSKYADGPGGFNNTGYQSQAPLSYATPAQYAQFDSGRKGKSGPGGIHEDALPAMPSWDNAASHRVPDESHHEESHEMNQMTPHEEQNAPMLAHQAPSPGIHGDQFGAGASPYQDHAGSNPDSFVTGAAAPSPYSHNASQNGGQYNDPYSRQDQQNPLSRYGQTATAAPLARPSPLAHQQSYASSQSAYGSIRGQNSYGPGYGQDTSYGVVGAQASRMSPPARSPTLQQGYGHSSPPPQHAYASSPPPPASGPTLPNVLQTGATPSPAPQGGYQAYGSAYSQAQSKPQYAAYNPNASEAASTRYEPSSYSGSAAGHGQHGYHDV